MTTSLNRLIAQLCSGNAAAAEEVFVAFEPYLRKAVRRQLPAPFRSRFDSADILQSVWADVLRGFRDAGWRFTDADHPGRSLTFTLEDGKVIGFVAALDSQDCYG